MTLEADLTLLLGAWDERLRNIDENLIALEGEPTYQMLSSGRASLTGITRERVKPALEALEELFLHRERLSDVLLRARELEKDAGFWDKGEKLSAAMALLQGPSIELPQAPTPLAQRTLLDRSSTDLHVSPVDLLAAMARAYEAARDVVAQVAAAWTRLEPRLAETEVEVKRLEKDAKSFGIEASTSSDLRVGDRGAGAGALGRRQ